MMTLNCRLAGLAVCTGVIITATACAQSPTALELAELAGLSPELRHRFRREPSAATRLLRCCR
jgi:hypothetical protein